MRIFKIFEKSASQDVAMCLTALLKQPGTG